MQQSIKQMEKKNSSLEEYNRVQQDLIEKLWAINSQLQDQCDRQNAFIRKRIFKENYDKYMKDVARWNRKRLEKL